MIPIKHIETDSNGVMLSENIEGQRVLEINLNETILPPHRIIFRSKETLSQVLSQLETLERSIHSVAEGLRAQIEEGGA